MKQVVFSGVKPTSVPHIGNYIGALKQWVEMQSQYKSYFCIVDEHSINAAYDPKELRERSMIIAAVYLACGLDPAKSTLFIQSEVPQHMELAWDLMNIAKMGELSRMTQFKDKSEKGGTQSASLGLFGYPVLMAADILLYDTNVVPVGEDQLQHVELTRVLARRFNEKFSDIFVIPQPLIQKVGAHVMSLQDASKKMSKSDDSVMGTIFLTDSDDDIRKKIMRAVTDTAPGVVFSEKKPAVANLMTIYHHMTGQSMKEIEKAFEGKGYGDFKKDLAEKVVATVSPIRSKITDLLKNHKELNAVLDHGRDQAIKAAEAKMKVVREKMGLGR
jgi:tryptophanyl-tRNA synthetase